LLKSLFPSSSSFHSSNRLEDELALFLSILLKVTSNIVLYISSVINTDTPFFSFSVELPPIDAEFPEGEVSPETRATDLAFDGSLNTTYIKIVLTSLELQNSTTYI
jgi:hypothetical protein